MSDFAIPACANCGHAIWPPRLACAVCGAADWTEVPAPTGTLEEVTEAPGIDGAPLRLGTVRLAVRVHNSSGQEDSWREEEGPPVVAVVDGDAGPGDEVAVELVDRALCARRETSQ